jgi:hypothetical protein
MPYYLGTPLKKLMQNKIIAYGMLLELLCMYSARRVADPDPHSFKLLDPDPGVNIAQEER